MTSTLDDSSLIPFCAALTLYFVIHSLLASYRVKEYVARRWPWLVRFYRLFFVTQATLLLLPLLWWMSRYPGPLLWEWKGGWLWIGRTFSVAAWIGLLWSLAHYDMGEFFGFRQWRDHITSAQDETTFTISPLHRFVRHPWYFLFLVILWTGDMHLFRLAAVVLIHAYFVVGSRLEEYKLIAYHGQVYRRYREAVPALMPRPWRYLSRADAKALLASAKPGQKEGKSRLP